MKLQGWALASSLTLIFAVSTLPSTALAFGGGDQAAAPKPERAPRTERGGRRPRRGEQAPAGGIDTARGMLEVPPLLASAGLACTAAAAGFLGETAAEGDLKNSVYEVACAEGPGYFLIANPDKTLKEGYDCFALKSGAEQQPSENAQLCRLPQNADPLANFKRTVAARVPGCTIDQARYLGSSPATKQATFEVGCAGSPGVLLRTAGPGTPAGTADVTTPCAALQPDGPVKCEYTTQEEVLAPLQPLIAASGKTCQYQAGRYVGVLTNGETAFEAKCAGDIGFMFMANAQGVFSRSLECARATGIAGGCTLVDAIAAQNAEASVYKGLAVKAGFNCDVDQYRLLGMEQGADRREVVELHCRNQPEGVIAFFPTKPQGPTNFYDCTKIASRNPALRCSLTPADVILTRLNKDVQKSGKTCDVKGYRAAGLTSRGKTEFVEVSCASGPGFMIEYAADPAPAPLAPATGVFTCAESANIGGGCKLPRGGA